MNIGKTYNLTHTVADSETADILGSGGLPVYSTPSMICLMERTAYSAAEEEGIQTVGTKVNISHLRACKVGTVLRSCAEVIELEGRRMLFNVIVSDNEGIIGEGTHERFAIDAERFMSKLR